MADSDTSIGGGRRFDTTQWSRIADYRQGSAEDRRQVLAELVRAYWKPVYRYVRIAWTRSNEDAKDLTQDFFVWLIDGDVLDRLQQERGRFRAFLKVVLRNFMTNVAESQRALKRGGGRVLVTIEEMKQADQDASVAGGDPGEAMDREWKRTLMARALDRLREIYAGLGKIGHFEIFRAYAFEGETGPSRREVAGRHGVTETDVKNYLVDARRRFSQIVRDLVSETVSDPEQLREELRELFGEGATS